MRASHAVGIGADMKTGDDAQLKAFADLMRKIGVNRFVVGSDWPALGPIAAYYALMRQKLPLTDAEWKQLWSNEAPWLEKAR